MWDIQRSSVLGVNYPRRKLSGCNYLVAIFLGGNCLGEIVQEAFVLVGQLSGGKLSREELSCSRVSQNILSQRTQYWINFQNTFTYPKKKKKMTSYAFSSVFKIVKSLRCILNLMILLQDWYLALLLLFGIAIDFVPSSFIVKNHQISERITHLVRTKYFSKS